jgi:aerobic-type carbon monoxide dehydrogenase small subunit (CoxS/CutS family)
LTTISQQCGCCIVLIDGTAEKSCAKPIRRVAGAAATTIEGLGSRDRPHPLQGAFLDEWARQCGVRNGLDDLERGAAVLAAEAE